MICYCSQTELHVERDFAVSYLGHDCDMKQVLAAYSFIVCEQLSEPTWGCLLLSKHTTFAKRRKNI